MGQKQTQRYCKDCQQNVLAVRKGTNHILHLLLTVLTGGIWLIVWLLISLGSEPWRCSQCGSTKTQMVSGELRSETILKYTLLLVAVGIGLIMAKVLGGI